MNNLTVFNNEQFGQLRTVTLDGEPWAVGKDVAEALKYTTPQKAIRDHVDEDDRRSERIVHPSGGTQETTIINESGIYSLIFSSKLHAAKAFKRWVTSEVLPAIRKTGAYSVQDYRAETRRLEADNKARSLALREQSAKDRRVNTILTSFIKAKTAPEKLALLAAYRAEGYSNPTLDMAEQAIIDGMNATPASRAAAPAKYDPNNFNELLRRLAEIGVRKNIYGVDYICVPTRDARKIATGMRVRYDMFLKWAHNAGYTRGGADGKNVVTMRLSDKPVKCVCLIGEKVGSDGMFVLLQTIK